ncbi:MAG TPA: hypothetical protein VLW53_18000 [Candidatus Eisenbacteria bacterium]|nr:hypothetical protein [Candidatus Eisenbacteria bacterium]
MNGPGNDLTMGLWGLVSLVTLARVTAGLGPIAAASWLISRRRRPAGS